MASSGVPQVEIVMTSPTATHGTGAAGSGLSFESPEPAGQVRVLALEQQWDYKMGDELSSRLIQLWDILSTSEANQITGSALCTLLPSWSLDPLNILDGFGSHLELIQMGAANNPSEVLSRVAQSEVRVDSLSKDGSFSLIQEVANKHHCSITMFVIHRGSFSSHLSSNSDGLVQQFVCSDNVNPRREGLIAYSPNEGHFFFVTPPRRPSVRGTGDSEPPSPNKMDVAETTKLCCHCQSIEYKGVVVLRRCYADGCQNWFHHLCSIRCGSEDNNRCGLCEATTAESAEVCFQSDVHN
jgi:hypothetical protein